MYISAGSVFTTADTVPGRCLCGAANKAESISVC